MHTTHDSVKGECTPEEALQTEVASLQALLGNEDAEMIAKKHIKLLHGYNEAKDAAQIIIGKLAVHKETTVKQLHEDYGLSADD